MNRIDILLLLLIPAFISLLFHLVPENTCPVAAGEFRRMVSLSPSITRELIDQEGSAFLAGTIYPYCPIDETVVDVGSFILPDWEVIARLRPDAVIMSKDDSMLQAGEILSRLAIPCLVIRTPCDFGDLCRQYMELAEMTMNEKKAAKKINSYMAEYERLCSQKSARPGFRLAFLVSFEPLVAACGRSHLGSIIRDAGARNAYENIERPYSIVSMESLLAKKTDLVIVMDNNPGDKYALSGNVTGKPAIPGSVVKRISTETAPYVTPRDYLETLKNVILLVKESREIE